MDHKRKKSWLPSWTKWDAALQTFCPIQLLALCSSRWNVKAVPRNTDSPPTAHHIQPLISHCWSAGSSSPSSPSAYFGFTRIGSAWAPRIRSAPAWHETLNEEALKCNQGFSHGRNMKHMTGSKLSSSGLTQTISSPVFQLALAIVSALSGFSAWTWIDDEWQVNQDISRPLTTSICGPWALVVKYMYLPRLQGYKCC